MLSRYLHKLNAQVKWEHYYTKLKHWPAINLTVGDNRGLWCSQKFWIHEAGYSSLMNPELPTSRSWRLCQREAKAGGSNFKAGISTIHSGSSNIDYGTSSFVMQEVPPSWSWKFSIRETGVSSLMKAELLTGPEAPVILDWWRGALNFKQHTAQLNSKGYSRV